MILQHLRNFEWMNEPMGVFFIDEGMKVVAEPETDFFQNERKMINKDNGHFFYAEKDGDFSLILTWKLNERPISAQSGIMVRMDEKNWANCFSIITNDKTYKICSSLTNRGFSDCCFQDINSENCNIWYKLERRGDYFRISFSTDGEKYNLFRNFTFINPNMRWLKIGAFICNPDTENFEAVLSYIELK